MEDKPGFYADFLDIYYMHRRTGLDYAWYGTPSQDQLDQENAIEKQEFAALVARTSPEDILDFPLQVFEIDRRWREVPNIAEDDYPDVTWRALHGLSQIDPDLFQRVVVRFFQSGLGTLAAAILVAISGDVANPGPNWVPVFADLIARVDPHHPFPEDILLVQEWSAQAKAEAISCINQ